MKKVNGRIFVNGYEFIEGYFKMTLKALYHKFF